MIKEINENPGDFSVVHYDDSIISEIFMGVYH